VAGARRRKRQKIVCRLKVICYLIDVRIDSNNNNNNRSKKKKKGQKIVCRLKSYLLSYRCKDRQQQQQQQPKTPLP